MDDVPKRPNICYIFGEQGVQTSESISENELGLCQYHWRVSCHVLTMSNVKCQISSVSILHERGFSGLRWLEWTDLDFWDKEFCILVVGFRHCKELCNTPISPHHQLAGCQICGVTPKKRQKFTIDQSSAGNGEVVWPLETHTLGRLASALIVWYSYGTSGHALPEALMLWKGSSEKTFSSTERDLLRKTSQ